MFCCTVLIVFKLTPFLSLYLSLPLSLFPTPSSHLILFYSLNLYPLSLSRYLSPTLSLSSISSLSDRPQAGIIMITLSLFSCALGCFTLRKHSIEQKRPQPRPAVTSSSSSSTPNNQSVPYSQRNTTSVPLGQQYNQQSNMNTTSPSPSAPTEKVKVGCCSRCNLNQAFGTGQCIQCGDRLEDFLQVGVVPSHLPPPSSSSSSSAFPAAPPSYNEAVHSDQYRDEAPPSYPEK